MLKGSKTDLSPLLRGALLALFLPVVSTHSRRSIAAVCLSVVTCPNGVIHIHVYWNAACLLQPPPITRTGAERRNTKKETHVSV